MKKYALVKNDVVISVEMLTEDAYRQKSMECQVIVDISELVIEPEIGWVLEGNALRPHSSNISLEKIEDTKMRNRFKVGNKVCDEAIVLISGRNRMLEKNSTQVNQIITTFTPIELAMRKCALPTALLGIAQMRSLFPEYLDIFDYVSSELTNYLNSEE